MNINNNCFRTIHISTSNKIAFSLLTITAVAGAALATIGLLGYFPTSLGWTGVSISTVSAFIIVFVIALKCQGSRSHSLNVIEQKKNYSPTPNVSLHIPQRPPVKTAEKILSLTANEFENFISIDTSPCFKNEGKCGDVALQKNPRRKSGYILYIFLQDNSTFNFRFKTENNAFIMKKKAYSFFGEVLNKCLNYKRHGFDVSGIKNLRFMTKSGSFHTMPMPPLNP